MQVFSSKKQAIAARKAGEKTYKCRRWVGFCTCSTNSGAPGRYVIVYVNMQPESL